MYYNVFITLITDLICISNDHTNEIEVVLYVYVITAIVYCYLINCLTIGLIANKFRSFRRNAYKILIGFRHGPISQDLSEPSTVKKYIYIYMYTARTDQSTSAVICVNVISSKTQGFKSCAKVMVRTRAGSASDKNQPIIIYLRVKERFFFLL